MITYTCILCIYFRVLTTSGMQMDTISRSPSEYRAIHGCIDGYEMCVALYRYYIALSCSYCYIFRRLLWLKAAQIITHYYLETVEDLQGTLIDIKEGYNNVGIVSCVSNGSV